jgi:mRNA-degrading endonuclease toxin of MazEF toxin-antitoxin module
MNRGDVCWCDLEPRSGSEQRGRRPVVVVSSDALNRVATWRTVVVVPCSTSPARLGRGPSIVALAPATCGIK